MADRINLSAFITFIVIFVLNIFLISTQPAKKPLKICSFNIQVFGEKKISDPKIFNEIIKVTKITTINY